MVVTNDYNLNKVARISGVKALNINDLANALKPMLAAGEEIAVEIVREGKEAGQGVAYLDDGTMIVVDQARHLVGKKADIVVSTVLQTSAGRMIFAALKNAVNWKGRLTVILFQSDYQEGADEEVLQALLATNAEQYPGYGEDALTGGCKGANPRAVQSPRGRRAFLYRRYAGKPDRHRRGAAAL